MDNSFRDGEVKTNGTNIEKILPPMRRFGGGNKTERKQTVISKIKKFFEKYFGLFASKEDENEIVYSVNEDKVEDYLMVAEESEEYKIDK